MKRYNLFLPDHLHKRFKLICVQEDKDMSEVVRALIQEYVKRVEKKVKK